MSILKKIILHKKKEVENDKVQFPIKDIKPQYNAVTTRGQGGSQFLDTLTLHGNGSIGNQNNMESNQIMSPNGEVKAKIILNIPTK